MPLYALKCPCCGTAQEVVAPASQRDLLDCINNCGVRLETDWSKGGPKPEREWDEKEGRSLRFAFSNGKKLAAGVPSAVLDKDGNLVFKSDRHQRKVYREMAAEKARIEHQMGEQTQKRMEREGPALTTAEKRQRAMEHLYG